MLKRLRQRIQDPTPESAEERGLQSMQDDSHGTLSQNAAHSLNEFDPEDEDDYEDSEDGEDLDGEFLDDRFGIDQDR